MPEASTAADRSLAVGRLPALAVRPVAAAIAVQVVLLTALSGPYGYERDELYFRMLRPAWGYVDQPPLTPLLARLTGHVSSATWALRVPATLSSAASVLVVVLITRELGGGRGAQTLCAWGYAFAAVPLLMGHVLLTSSLDLVVWPLVCLFALRAVLRDRPQWWVAAGVTIGLSTYNKLLVALLVIALLAGMLLAGPRRALLSRWMLLAAGLALVIALPNLIFQIRHHWPQLTMSRALSRDNAGSVRIVMWPYLLLMLGPPLVPVWIAGLSGLSGLRRRPAWRPVRFLVPAFAVLLLETFVGGGQLYYPFGLLAVLFAAGCAAVLDPGRRVLVAGVAVNGAVSALIAVPLLPVSVLASSPVPAINPTVGDQIGWPDYVRQVAAVYSSVPAAEHPAIITSNYGEAGAIVRYGPDLRLPRPYSGQNQLWFDARPPEGTATVLIVGGQLGTVRDRFDSCVVTTRLRNRAGVDNEEEGEPVAVCRGPRQGWAQLWPAFQHYD